MSPSEEQDVRDSWGLMILLEVAGSVTLSYGAAWLEAAATASDESFDLGGEG